MRNSPGGCVRFTGMPLVDPSGPRWVKDLRIAQERRPKRGFAAVIDRIFNALFGWLR